MRRNRPEERKQTDFISKLLIKDNDDDLFHQALRMDNNVATIRRLFRLFCFPKALNENFWDLFAFC